MSHESLVEGNITRGKTIILSVIPPTPFKPPVLSVKEKKVKLMLNGPPIIEPGKANAIYMLISYKNRENQLVDNWNLLRTGGHVCSTGLKCHIDNNGQPVFDHNAFDPHSIISRTITEILNPADTLSRTSVRTFTLTKLNKSLTMMAEDLSTFGLCSIIGLVSNYDISLSNLRRFFADKTSPVLFASFKRNLINIEISGA